MPYLSETVQFCSECKRAVQDMQCGRSSKGTDYNNCYVESGKLAFVSNGCMLVVLENL